MTLALYGKSRKRRGGLLLAALLAVLAATLGGLALVGTAFAHNSTITGTASCNADGTWNVHWVITNDFNLVATITNPTQTTTPTFAGMTIPANGGSGTTSVSADTNNISAGTSTIQLKADVFWTDGYGDGHDANYWNQHPTPLNPYASNIVSRPDNCTGTIQVHKYLPKDNVNTPWQNQGNGQSQWTFNIYNNSDLAANHLVASGNQLGTNITGIPETDLWVTESASNGYTLAGFFLPDGDGTSGNDHCDQQPANGSTFSSPLHILASQWTTKGNHTGTLHVCAYNRPVGNIVVKKVRDPNGAAADSTPFGGKIDGSTTWGTILIGGATSPISVSTGNHAVTETTLSNGWTTVGFALGTSDTCPSAASSYTGNASSFTAAVTTGQTTYVCVMNTKQAEVILPKIVKTAGNPATDATKAYWNIEIQNGSIPTPLTNILITDPGATLVSTTPSNSANGCVVTVAGTSFTCKVGANTNLEIKVSKPLSAATNANNKCLPGTIGNSITSATIPGAAPVPLDVTNPAADITVPGVASKDCLTVTKTWDPNTGANGSYIITFTNTGPGTTVNVKDSSDDDGSGEALGAPTYNPAGPTCTLAQLQSSNGCDLTVPTGGLVITIPVTTAGSNSTCKDEDPYNKVFAHFGNKYGDAISGNGTKADHTIRVTRTDCDNGHLYIIKVVSGSGSSGNDVFKVMAKGTGGAPDTGDQDVKDGLLNAATFSVDGTYYPVETDQNGYKLLGYSNSVYGLCLGATTTDPSTLAHAVSKGHDWAFCVYNQKIKVTIKKVVEGNLGDTTKFTVNQDGNLLPGDISSSGDKVSTTGSPDAVYTENSQTGYTQDGPPIVIKGHDQACPSTPPVGTAFNADTFTQTDEITICFYNKLANRTITVCKIVDNNNDVNNDGGEFKFDIIENSQVTQQIGITAHESDANGVCKDVVVHAGVNIGVTEWTNQPDHSFFTVGGYPKYQVDGGTSADGNVGPAPLGTTLTKVTFHNKKDPVPQHVTFAKVICQSFKDVPANQGDTPYDLPAGFTKADLGAEYPATDDGIMDLHVPTNCHLAGAGWTFELSGSQGALGTPVTGAGGTVDYTLTSTELADAQTGPGGLNVKEDVQTGYGFGSIKCYNDHLYQDNAEWIDLSQVPSGTTGVYCVAYNVPLRHIIIHKIVDNVVDDSQTFDFTVDGSSVGSTAETDANGITKVVDAGGHTVAEGTLPPGYEFVGVDFCQVEEQTAAQVAKEDVVAVPSTTVDPGTGDVVLCFHNKRSTGHITVNKVVIGQSGIIENGKFNLQINGVTYAADVADGGTTGSQEFVTGNYTVGETAGTGTNLSDYSPTISCTDNGDPFSLGLPTVTLLANHDIVCTITNRRNPVESTPSITVEKFSDPAGNFTGTGGRIGNWPITITGVSGPAIGHTYTQNTGNNPVGDPANFGVAHFDGIEEGTWKVEEPSSTVGYVVVGSTLNGVAQDPDYIRDGADVVTAFHGTNPVVRFYNQPLVSIHVTKTEVTAGGTGPGDGWAITVKGCTVNQTKNTASGVADFTNLPICQTGYTVSENTLSKTGFLPVGPSSVVVAGNVAGTTYNVSFENTQLTPGCVTNCITNNPTPTPTPPTPTATPPTPTTVPPTATPTTPKPSPTDVVLGEKTPGPGSASTPIAPSTGSGLFGTSGGSTNMLLALFGLFALSGGLATLAFSRRKSRN